ncbi:hypothetical protein EHO59_09035 [Leptospira semungkisensis]|uniref:Inverse autotransporter beta-domain domain-containing protein n=1 Tax=Leptospira semungkisensis TaxID=2484985 RepID=A0A4V3JC71_9LEPT|nr:hypothetical protein [Leptospira semungkisensis]TGK04979.1 hypothetical protein EHO59_09035 [Leptospira semungkisensis]
MRLRNIVLLLLPISGVFGRSSDLPNEFLVRPWWKDGEISVFGITEPGNRKEGGGILQIPFWKKQTSESRFLWVGRDRASGFSQILSLGHKLEVTPHFGLQFQIGGSPGENGFFLGSLGAYTKYASLSFLNRRSLEESSVGAILRSDPNSEFRLGISYERTRTNLGIWEDKISFGFTWGIDRFLGDLQFQEKDNHSIGYASLGFSPFRTENGTNDRIDSESKRQTRSPKERKRSYSSNKILEKSYPSLETDELLKYGFSIQESLEISGHSRQSSVKFEAFLRSLPEAKQIKIQSLIRKKRGSK